MRVKLLVAILILASSLFAGAQNRKPKNVIVMIPDGTSSALLSLSRWYQGYKNGDIKNIPPLAVDGIVCGMVRTHSSNAPIGDSAPAGSWYATGEASKAGYVGMYSPSDPENDLVHIDETRAYQPLMTVLEASKLSGKKTGLVVTCHYPHATPADFSSHWYRRSNYKLIAQQMAYNNIDLIFGGGSSYLTKEAARHLLSCGYDTVVNNIEKFRAIKENKNTKVWALFGEVDLPYDIDRNPGEVPSLSEMTKKAIDILSKNENGFFLMVEGSKVDWAAHANDPIGVITEFLAFDKAVATALNFAKKNGETVIVVLPDHSTGGVTFGNKNSNSNYSKLSVSEIFDPLVNWKMTPGKAAGLLTSEFKPDIAAIEAKFNEINSKIKLTKPERDEFLSIHEKWGNDKKNFGDKIADLVLRIAQSRNYIGFTTTGHTGEDVFLAVYDPSGRAPVGVIRSDDVNRYICASLGLVNKKGETTLKDSTQKYYASHDKVFLNCAVHLIKNDSLYKWNSESKSFKPVREKNKYDLLYADNDKESEFADNAVIVIEKGENRLEIPSYTNIYFYNSVKNLMNTISIYVDKNDRFYLPRQLFKLFK